MSIASEITRLQTSKADIKAQVNIDVDDINEGTDFIDEETLDDYADLIEDMQEAYKQYIPINSTSDTQIEAPKGGAIIGKTIKGNTSQNGTPTPTAPIEVNNVTGEQVVTICRKNLFNKSNITNGRLDANGNVAIIDEYFTSPFIKVEPNTQYTKNSPTADAYHRVCFYSSNNISDFISRSESNTITTPSNCQYLRFCGLDTEIDTTQLEKGSSATSYEEYQGKDYEINLGNIELNKIGTYQDYIRKGTGKNLLNLAREQGTFTGNGTQFDENYFYPNMARDSGVGSGCETIGYANNVLTIKGRYGQGVGYPIKCIPNTQYCVKAKSSDSNARLWVSFYDSTGNFISGSANDTDLERIVTTPNNAYWLIVVFGVNGSSYINVNYSEIQIKQNSQVTYYEPFGYKDKWYIEKNVGKVVLNGSETWNAYNTSVTDHYRYAINVADIKKTSSATEVPNILSTRYSKQIMGTAGSWGAHQGIAVDNTNTRIYINDDTYYTNDATQFKTWLSNNNVTVYYALANSTYTLIENEELTEQLDRTMQLYEGQNNILVTGDLAATLDLDYIVKAENHL